MARLEEEKNGYRDLLAWMRRRRFDADGSGNHRVLACHWAALDVLVPLSAAPQASTEQCGHLIRDGQTTVGACQLATGHGGEHMRGSLCEEVYCHLERRHGGPCADAPQASTELQGRCNSCGGAPLAMLGGCASCGKAAPAEPHRW